MIRSEMRPQAPPLPNSFYEYRSATFLGLPLLHVCRGQRPEGTPSVARGWIAVGDRACGILLGVGGVACGIISCGGICFGLVPLGGLAVGALPLGGVAFGIGAVGGLSIGYLAFGGCAIGWHAASGGFAVARHLALGGLALAAHANDPSARAFFTGSSFFRYGQFLLTNRWVGRVFWLVLASCLWPLMVRRDRGAWK